MTELERYKEAVRVVRERFRNIALEDFYVDDTLKMVDDILNPTPGTVTVDVERWTWGNGQTTCESREGAEMLAGSLPVYQVRGSYQRVKGECMVRVDAFIGESGFAYGLKYDEAFKDHPETFNRPGYLTFTWEE